MSTNTPIDPAVRLAIAHWPDDAGRGAVTSFCTEHGISRKTFYLLRARAATEGQAAVLEPKSRRPTTSPTRIDETVKDQAVNVRAALEASGWDAGPISVHDKMTAMGLDAPSVASLARIFRERGIARKEPKKKPRAAYRRFVYPAPNACWQLDATDYVLTRGRTCVIFQLQDDHSRLAVASLVAHRETGDAAVAVFDKAVAAYGVPQRLLTDNGSALNQSRRGWENWLVTHVKALGVEPMTGKPGKPTTQGKNERFHQTLLKWLAAHPMAGSLEELQALVDVFDHRYNTERPHQGLPERMTPQQAWDTTDVAEAPTPPVDSVRVLTPRTPPARPAPPTTSEPVATPAVDDGVLGLTASGLPRPMTTESGARLQRIASNGAVAVNSVQYLVSYRRAGDIVTVAWDRTGMSVAAEDGLLLAEYNWPPVGTNYVSRHLPNGQLPTDEVD